MNWNVNHSFLDITLNICNFNYSKSQIINNKLIASINYSDIVANFNKDAYTVLYDRKLDDPNFALSKIATTQISPQLKSWNNANKFIDYYTFSAKIGDWMYGLVPAYYNYYNQSVTQTYAFNYSSALDSGCYFYKTFKYKPIYSKVTNKIVYANTYNTPVPKTKLLAMNFFGANYGNVIIDFGFFPFTPSDNYLYISIWYEDYGLVWAHFHIKVSNAIFNMNYNTNVFDNIYKI